jgi:hypothetical protein
MSKELVYAIIVGAHKNEIASRSRQGAVRKDCSSDARALAALAGDA